MKRRSPIFKTRCGAALNTSGTRFNQAAQFCLTKKIKLEEGLKWADASIQNEERFENLTTKADLLKAMNKPEDAKKTWEQAIAKTTPVQLYSYARRLMFEKKDAEAMEILKEVAKRYSDTPFGHLSNARIKSAAGDFAGAAEDAKKAQAVAISDQQKKNIQALIDRFGDEAGHQQISDVVCDGRGGAMRPLGFHCYVYDCSPANCLENRRFAVGSHDSYARG